MLRLSVIFFDTRKTKDKRILNDLKLWLTVQIHLFRDLLTIIQSYQAGLRLRKLLLVSNMT